MVQNRESSGRGSTLAENKHVSIAKACKLYKYILI